ncbi:MAG: nodulation protein NfeD [Acidobacteria bacterium]|nr:nodulation protein NfeD [Acidobacteriota bacterium]
MPKYLPPMNAAAERVGLLRFLAAAIISCVLGLSLPGRAQTPNPLVMEIHIDGMIHPIAAEYVTAGMEQATQRQASLILIQISTPGGLDSSMRQIIEKIISSPIPVAVYVAPSGSRAASAGFFILLAADVAAMAPGTNTGAAHPVLLGGGQIDDVMKEKVTNDAAAYLRSIVSKRGRNVEVAEKGVTESKSFTDFEALKEGLIEISASDRADLLAQLDGHEITRFDGKKQVLHLQGAQVEVYVLSFRQMVLSRILDPNVAFILLILGILGLYVEFSNPGLILPGVAGGIAIILALFALSLLPLNWAGAALILLAIVFFVLEAKFVTHGILAAGGVLSMVLGALMLINTRMPGARITLVTALSVALPFAMITIFLLRLVIRARQRKISTGDIGLIGEIGKVEVPLSPSGKIYVHGELWEAVSSSPAPSGTLVQVKSVEGLTLFVEPLPSSLKSESKEELEPKQKSAKGA